MHCQSHWWVPKTAAVLTHYGHGNPLQHAGGGGATEALQSSPKDGTPTHVYYKIIYIEQLCSHVTMTSIFYSMHAMYITLREIYNYI